LICSVNNYFHSYFIWWSIIGDLFVSFIILVVFIKSW